jgi:hypothetical protein
VRITWPSTPAACVVFAMFDADFAKLASDIPELHARIDAAAGRLSVGA